MESLKLSNDGSCLNEVEEEEVHLFNSALSLSEEVKSVHDVKASELNVDKDSFSCQLDSSQALNDSALEVELSQNGLVSNGDCSILSASSSEVDLSISSEVDQSEDGNSRIDGERVLPGDSELVGIDSSSASSTKCEHVSAGEALSMKLNLETKTDSPLQRDGEKSFDDEDESQAPASVASCSTNSMSNSLYNSSSGKDNCSDVTNESDVLPSEDPSPVDLSTGNPMDVEESSDSLEAEEAEVVSESLCKENMEIVASAPTELADKPNCSAEETVFQPDNATSNDFSRDASISSPVSSPHIKDQQGENTIHCISVKTEKPSSFCGENENEDEPQDLSMELPRRKTIEPTECLKKVSSAPCDSEPFSLKSEVKCEELSDEEMCAFENDNPNNLNGNSTTQMRYESSPESSNNGCASHDKIDPHLTQDIEMQKEGLEPENLVMSKPSNTSTFSFPDNIKDNEVEKKHSSLDDVSCEAVDLTKAQVDRSVATPKPSDSPECMSAEKTPDPECSENTFQPLSNKETGFPETFNGLVTIGKYVSVKGDFTLRSSEALVESPSLIAPFLLKEPDVFPQREEPLKAENRNFFQTSIGEFLVGLGLSRCNEWYYRDLVHFKSKQIRREGKLPHLEQDIKSLQSNYLQAKMANEPYVFSKKTCSCGFSTESSIVLEGHMLAPHVTPHKEYECCFCSYLHRDPKSILNHMKVEHNKVGHINLPPCLYECANCMFDCNTKQKLGKHLNRCAKFYDPATVQLPPKDFDYPCLTPKPITVAVVKAYEKSLSSMQGRYIKPRKSENILDTFQKHLNQLSNTPRVQLPYDSNYNVGMPDSTPQLTPSFSHKKGRPSHPSFHGAFNPLKHPQGNYFSAANNNNAMYSTLTNNAGATSSLSFPYPAVAASQKGTNHPFKGAFSTLLPHPPKLQGPYPMPADKSISCLSSPLQPNSLVVCEICDGYIKDMEQLRTHMQLIHKVKIHPKVLSSRPPLNCQKCQWRFFTDQGLERHLLGAHGLVTSNMQDMANKNKDSGCCTICGRVFASKLVVHMNQLHKITLKPAHLSYKCTVCSATFNLYRLFENHVYLVHSSSSSKRAADSSEQLLSKKVARSSNWEQSVSQDKHSRYLAEKENGAA